MIPPPDAAALRRAAELCEFCPKMCRFSCPVSEAEPREAFTPWGKASLAALTAVAGRAPESSAAAAFHACTGCLRCRSYCAHANDVPTMLFAARAASVRAGVAPGPMADLAARFARRGHGKDDDVAATIDALRAGAEPQRKEPPPALFPGCRPDSGRAALDAARALGAPLGVVPGGAVCCGLDLLEAGHPDLFAAHALRTRSALLAGRAGAPAHLVFLAPACARAVRDRWPGHGAALPAGSIVEHATTYLARALALRPDLRARPKLPGPVAYHDPCELARGLGEVEAPRALLAAAVEGGALEPLRTGADASCCGAGGLLPLALPAAADAVAMGRTAELRACGAPAVTASPACAAMLGAGDVVALVARWLSAGGGT